MSSVSDILINNMEPMTLIAEPRIKKIENSNYKKLTTMEAETLPKLEAFDYYRQVGFYRAKQS